MASRSFKQYMDRRYRCIEQRSESGHLCRHIIEEGYNDEREAEIKAMLNKLGE